MRETMNVAINGFGRVGRSVLKLVIERNPGFEVTVINDPGDNRRLAHLLEHDSSKGTWDREIRLDDDRLIVEEHPIKLLSQTRINQINWNAFDVDLVLEASGQFTTRRQLRRHIESGAGHVLATTSVKDADQTIIQGLNNDDLRLRDHTILSNATCTAHALAPIVDVIDSNFSLVSGVASVNHSLTRSQSLKDDFENPSRRKGRAAPESIIPASTPAAELLATIEPDWQDRIGSTALRLPVKNVSAVLFSAQVDQHVTRDQMITAFSLASDQRWSGLLDLDANRCVSSDFVQTPYSCVVDEQFIRTVGTNHVRVIGWYDNEWGYSNRLLELIDSMASKL